jgi:hypothetical protein
MSNAGAGWGESKNGLAADGCQLIEPPLRPSAHLMGWVADEVVVNYSSSHGVKDFPKSGCKDVAWSHVASRPWGSN